MRARLAESAGQRPATKDCARFAACTALTLIGTIVAAPARAQTAPAPAAQGAGASALLFTIFLRHDQTKTLAQIQQHLKETGFDTSFPPPGIEVVSWYVMMGIGQVVTLRVPPERLREVNRVIEEKGWAPITPSSIPHTITCRSGVRRIRSGEPARQPRRAGPKRALISTPRYGSATRCSHCRPDGSGAANPPAARSRNPAAGSSNRRIRTNWSSR